MHDDEQARQLFGQAVSDLAARGLLDCRDRWEHMAVMAQALPAITGRERLEPLDTALLFLLHCLEQFPDAVPLDEESYHGQVVHTLLWKLYETLLMGLDRREGMEFHDGPPRGSAPRP